jgi:hypothetical protein
VLTDGVVGAQYAYWDGEEAVKDLNWGWLVLFLAPCTGFGWMEILGLQLGAWKWQMGSVNDDTHWCTWYKLDIGNVQMRLISVEPTFPAPGPL